MILTLLKDLELGERIKVTELHQLIAENPNYQNFTIEEKEKLKQDVLELYEQKKVGAHPTNKSAAHDYHAQMMRINDEVHCCFISYYFFVNPLQISALSERTGAAAVAFFSCSNL
jgi:hypothetical protein